MTLVQRCVSYVFLALVLFNLNAAVAASYKIGGNKSPIYIETTKEKESGDTVTLVGSIKIKTPMKVIKLRAATVELSDYNKKAKQYDRMVAWVDSNEFFKDLLPERGMGISSRPGVKVKLSLKPGKEIKTPLRITANKKYFVLEGRAGKYLHFGAIDFTIPQIESHMKYAFDFDLGALYFEAGVSGLGSFLFPVDYVAVGISQRPNFLFRPRSKYGINVKQNTFKGHIGFAGSATTPKIPVNVKGEFISLLKPPLYVSEKVGVNGRFSMSYKFSGALGLDLKLGKAAMIYQEEVLFGRKQRKQSATEFVFSGVQDPKFSFLPKNFPLQPNKKIKLAGRISTRLERSYVRGMTDFRVLNIPMTQGNFLINKQGVRAVGFWKTPLTQVRFSGTIKKKKVSLRGSAKAGLSIKGLAEVVETVTNGAVCGYKFAESGAKCGYKVARNGAKCGYELVKGAAICSVEHMAHHQRVKWCALKFIGKNGKAKYRACVLASYQKLNGKCRRAKRCKFALKCRFPKTCKRVVKVPNQRLGEVSATIALHILNKGMGGRVRAQFCPVKKKACVRLKAADVNLDLSNLKKPRLCVKSGIKGLQAQACTPF